MMDGEGGILDELERRLIATFYDASGKPANRRTLRHWGGAAAAAIATALILAAAALALLSGGVSPSPASAALDRAAVAARDRPALALGPGEAWHERTIVTWTVPMPTLRSVRQHFTQPLVPFSTVKVVDRTVTDSWLTRDGAVTERTVSSVSFANSADALRYGGPLQRPTTTTQRLPARGRLRSPLLPVPLISYKELISLPTRVSELRPVISRLYAQLEAAERAAAARASERTPPPLSSPSPPTSRAHPARTTATHTETGTVVGTCCGAAPVTKRAVADLEMIGWLLALPVPADVRAALYRTAATLPGVRYDGLARDALGREGTEISVGSGAEQMRMIFDERTGALLAASTGFGPTALNRGFGPLVETIQSAAVVASPHLG